MELIEASSNFTILAGQTMRLGCASFGSRCYYIARIEYILFKNLYN